jgi:hypothetical protein
VRIVAPTWRTRNTINCGALPGNGGKERAELETVAFSASVLFNRHQGCRVN